MKKLTKWMAIIGIIVMMNFNSYSQVSVLGNAGAAGNYVGWNAAQLFPVTVSHKGNFPINFQTNGTQRMTIMNTTGFVGIGAGFTAPKSYLHIDDNGIFGRMFQVTNVATGINVDDGFLIRTVVQGIIFNHQESGIWAFSAGNSPSGNNAIRMAIN